MCNLQGLARNAVMAQERMFRLAERDHSLSLAVLSSETGIPKRTLQEWKCGTTMPAWALFALGKAGVPDYLTSLVGSPYKKTVGTDTYAEGELHDAAREATTFTKEYLEATAPDSEAGPDISPREGAKLREVAGRAGHKLRAVA